MLQLGTQEHRTDVCTYKKQAGAASKWATAESGTAGMYDKQGTDGDRRVVNTLSAEIRRREESKQPTQVIRPLGRADAV